MDSKVTLSFNKHTIEATKRFAEEKGISLSRLTEFLYRQVIMKPYDTLEDMPVSDWVNMVSEGEVEYKTSSPGRKKLKTEYFKSKK